MIVDGVELPFPSLDALISFVRRLYLGGAAGTPNPGGGGGPLPIPDGDRSGPLTDPEDRRERPSESAERGRKVAGLGSSDDPSAALLGDAAAFEKSSQELKGFGEAKFFQWSDNRGKPMSGARACDRLASGAIVLIYETLARLPRSVKGVPFAMWRLYARQLARAIDRMGLWPLIFEYLKKHPHLERQWIAALERVLRQLAPLWHDPGAAQALIDDVIQRRWFRNCVLRDALHGDLFAAAWWRYGPGMVWNRHVALDVDAWEDLDGIVIPPNMAPPPLKAIVDRVSLRQLLQSVCCTPGAMIASGHAPPPDEAWTDILLFAAASVVSSSWPSRDLSVGHPFYDGEEEGIGLDLARDAAGDLLGQANTWLAANLPQWAFPHRVEELLEEAQAHRNAAAAPNPPSDSSSSAAVTA